MLNITVLAGGPAPPIPVSLMIAWVMLLLFFALAKARDSNPKAPRVYKIPRHRGLWAMVTASVTVIAFQLWFEPRNMISAFPALIGGLVGAFFWRTTRVPFVATESKPRSGMLWLTLLAFLSGPLIGLLWAWLDMWITPPSPHDVGYNYFVFTSVGTVGGFFGACLVLLNRVRS